MKKRTKQYFTAGTIAAMMVSSYGTSVSVMAAKVTLPRTAKVVVGAKKVLKLKNNKRAVKWKVSKGKKYVKIVKKSKKSCTVKRGCCSRALPHSNRMKSGPFVKFYLNLLIKRNLRGVLT